jgi:hypothetical protein
MELLLKNAFKTQIENKREFDFEDFIDELFLLKYGADNYLPIRRVRDNGNDGTIISERKILACYAPKKYVRKDFEVKVLGSNTITGDFEKYKSEWESNFPNWEMLVNHDVAPEQLTIIDNLDGNTSIKGIKQIISIIEDLPRAKLRKLAKFLEIDSFIIQDYIRDILNDLLTNSIVNEEIIKYKHAPYIPKKIEINYNEEDVDGALSEFQEISQNFNIVENILVGYEDDEKGKIKYRVIEDFNKLSGSFKEKLSNLTVQYTEKYGNINDDDYRFYVKTILLYMFEQCLIGKKTEKEK